MPAVVIRWPGGEHAFALPLASLEVVQQRTDFGPEFLLHRINASQWRTVDLFEVLRNGLIGAGMSEAEAFKLVDRAFAAHPLIGFKVPAQMILAAALYGPADDPVGEPSPAGDPTPQSEMDDGDSAPITASAR